MGALRDEADKLGIEIDGRWSNGTLQRKIAEFKSSIEQDKARAKVPEAPVSVRLLKHYKPMGWYEIVGHFNADEKLVDGMAPPPIPGVTQAHKIWAGTVIKLPADEARRLVENIASQVVTDRDPDTKHVIGKREVRTRKPLAEVQVEWDGRVEYAP